MDKAALELLLAQGLSVERIAMRFDKHPSTVAYWMERHGLEAVNREKHGPKGGVEREQLEDLVNAGMSTRQIGSELRLSQATVRHWLRRYGLRTDNMRDADETKAWKEAKEAGRVTVVMSCRRHGETDFVLEGRGYYRCKRCRMEAVANRRRKVKAILVAEAGGRCAICGYDRYVGALEFHHVDPEAKQLQISGTASLRRWMLSASKPASACCCAPTAMRKSRLARLSFPAMLRRDLRDRDLRRTSPVPLNDSASRSIDRVGTGWVLHRNQEPQYTIIWGSSIGRANGC